MICKYCTHSSDREIKRPEEVSNICKKISGEPVAEGKRVISNLSVYMAVTLQFTFRKLSRGTPQRGLCLQVGSLTQPWSGLPALSSGRTGPLVEGRPAHWPGDDMCLKFHCSKRGFESTAVTSVFLSKISWGCFIFSVWRQLEWDLGWLQSPSQNFLSAMYEPKGRSSRKVSGETGSETWDLCLLLWLGLTENLYSLLF